MALGNKKCRALRSKSTSEPNEVNGEESVLGLEVVKFSRGLGRKRVLISGEAEESMFDSPAKEIPAKRVFGDTLISGGRTSRLESLPEEILVRIMCGVEHEDLKQLFHVSKTVRAATLIAKQSHFAYSTPKKSIFRNNFDPVEPIDLGVEFEAPNAPKLRRIRRSRIGNKQVSEISTSLFS